MCRSTNRYCPWCFKESSGSVCEEDGCNLATTRTEEDVKPSGHPFIGHTVDWRYRVTKFIAKGGFGAVYKAYDRFADIMVAIKFLCESPDDQLDEDIRQRFVKEATVLGRLRHQNIVALYDVEGLQTGPPCIIMELLRGEDLECRLRPGPLSPLETLEWLIPVCQAIKFAHSYRILHLDIKPSNIFCCEYGNHKVIKVLDFGIAQIAGARAKSRGCGLLKVYGTPQYVAPEVALGKPAPQSDLYSLGVVMYQALTCTMPFPWESWEELLSQYQGAKPKPLSTELGLPGRLVELIMALLEMDHKRRPSSASEVLDKLLDIRAGLAPCSGRPVHIAHSANSHKESGDAPTVAPTASSRPRLSFFLFVFASALGIGIALGVLLSHLF